MKLSARQLFGGGFYQDASVIRINKSDLIGLTPAAENSAESILCALVLNAQYPCEGFLETSSGERLTTVTGESLEFSNLNLYPNLNVFLWRITFPSEHINHQFVITLRAGAEIPYEQPIKPSDL